MKTLCIILLAFCIVSSAYGQLHKPEQQKRSLRENFFNHFLYSQSPMSIKTQCNNVNLSQYYNGVSLSGYLNVGLKNSNSALGFIFFGAKGVKAADLKKRPTIIWLEGGPGCTSQYGTFIEVGPLKIQEKGNGTFSFYENKFAWTNDYNVIFIDQPIGTGISYAQQKSDIPVDENQVASQFYYALNELYDTKNGCFNQLGINGRDTPLFIYGISYAGKYIPAISQLIVQKGNRYNLKGIGMGDGFTSPYYDTQALNQFSFDKGLINTEQYQKNQIKVNSIQKFIREQKFKNATTLFLELLGDVNPSNIDIYNIGRKAFPDSSYLDNLINSDYFQKTFKFQLSKKFEQCDPVVYEVLSNDFIQEDCVTRVNYLLNQGIHVHVYNGDLDLIVPYYTPQLWLPTLQWFGIDKFVKTPIRVWRNEKTVFGTRQQHDRLTSTLVFNAGHMVTEDQPEAGLSLIRNDINYVLSLKQ